MISDDCGEHLHEKVTNHTFPTFVCLKEWRCDHSLLNHTKSRNGNEQVVTYTDFVKSQNI